MPDKYDDRAREIIDYPTDDGGLPGSRDDVPRYRARVAEELRNGAAALREIGEERDRLAEERDDLHEKLHFSLPDRCARVYEDARQARRERTAAQAALLKMGIERDALKAHVVAYESRNARFRCADHPDVVAERMWGCPDCLRQAKARVEELEADARQAAADDPRLAARRAVEEE